MPESHYQVQEKYCGHTQTAEIEDLLFDFDKRNQLIIVHQHAEGKVNPPHHSKLRRFSLHPSQLKSVIDVLNDEDSD